MSHQQQVLFKRNFSVLYPYILYNIILSSTFYVDSKNYLPREIMWLGIIQKKVWYLFGTILWFFIILRVWIKWRLRQIALLGKHPFRFLYCSLRWIIKVLLEKFKHQFNLLILMQIYSWIQTNIAYHYH